MTPITDPWTRRKMAAFRAEMARTGIGNTEPTEYGPPPRGEVPIGMILGWGAVVAAAAGVFWLTTRGAPSPVRANRRRRSSRRRSSKRRSTRRRVTRRNTRRRTSRRYVLTPNRRYKALSAAARSRMPETAFALPGKRWPLEGPPGSSRERDKWQALQAIRYLNMGRVSRKSDYVAIRSGIIRRYGAKFWRDNGGPSWSKVEKAKRTRRRTRRGTKRRTTRRLAANARPSKLPQWMNKAIYWGRYSNHYYVEAPNRNVRFYRGEGAKARAREVAQGLADRYGLPVRKSDRKRPRRVSKNGRKTGRGKARRISNKSLRKIVDKAKKQGFQVSFTGGGHIRFVPPDPNKPIVISGSTPSDHRAIQNLQSQLKRSGLKPNRRR